MKFWNREVETMSRDALEALQLKGLQKTLRRVWGCEWWRDLLQKRGMGGPEDVKSLDDLRNLPFLTKEDFREAYPLQRLHGHARGDGLHEERPQPVGGHDGPLLHDGRP